jgi:hypothetical protein
MAPLERRRRQVDHEDIALLTNAIGVRTMQKWNEPTESKFQLQYTAQLKPPQKRGLARAACTICQSLRMEGGRKSRAPLRGILIATSRKMIQSSVTQGGSAVDGCGPASCFALLLVRLRYGSHREKNDLPPGEFQKH